MEKERSDGAPDAGSRQPIMSRRAFLGAAGGVVAMIGLGGAAKALAGGQLLRPPGGQDESAFLARCLKCVDILDDPPGSAFHAHYPPPDLPPSLPASISLSKRSTK